MRSVHDRSFALAMAVLATVVIVLAADGCGGSSSGDRRSAEPTAPVAPAVDHQTLVRALAATRAVESGRVEVATALTHLDDASDPPPGGRVTVATYRVTFDRRSRRVDVETDMSGAASVLGTGDAAARDDLSVAARMVAAGDVVYAQGGPMAAAVGRPPTDWVEIDRAAFADRGPNSDAGALVLDPLGPLRVLGDAADTRVIGRDEIRGSPVTHLATSVASGGGTAPVDVWIDTDGVIRRMEIRLAGEAGEDAGGLVTTVELFDIDRAVDITAPGGER